MTRILLLPVLLLSLTFSSSGQTITSLPAICVDSSEQVILPVHVENYTSIGAFQFALVFDTASLTYMTINGAPSGTAVNLDGNTLYVGWVADIPYPPISPSFLTIPNGILMNIVMDYTGPQVGMFDFVPVMEITTMQTGVPVIVQGTYINGMVQTTPSVYLTSGSGTATQTICIQHPVMTISYAVGGSATGVGITGLPPGVTSSFNTGEVTINGVPTATGIYPYTVTTTGTSCPPATATGTLTVTELPSLDLTSQAGTTSQTVCQSTPISDVTYAVGGSATGAEALGLPPGVTGSIHSNVFTISGIPSWYGTYSYTVTTTGGVCAATATGTIHVNPQPVSSITGESTMCMGASTTLTATGGPWVATTWNSSNQAVAKVTDSGLVTGISGGVATIVLTVSNGMCSSGYDHPMTVGSSSPVSVSISASGSQVCAGTPVTVTATPVNGGTSPLYQWRVNGGNTGTNHPVFTYLPSNNDVVTCVLTSNATCVTGNPAISNQVTIIVHPIPVITNTPLNKAICNNSSSDIHLESTVAGTVYTYTAYCGSANVSGYSNGFSNPIDQVLMNAGSAPETVRYNIVPYTLSGCLGTPVNYFVTVNPSVSVSFQPSTLTIPSGQTTNIILISPVPGTIFTWTAVASSPNVSGYSNGSDDRIIQTIVNTGSTAESVYYLVTPAANGCSGTPSMYVVQILAAPSPSVILQDITVLPGQDVCYDALQMIAVAGNGTEFIVEPGGSCTMIAGQMINYYPGTLVESGGYLWGYIAPSGPFCSQPSLPEVVSGNQKSPFTGDEPFFKVYPNPAGSLFIVEFSGKPPVGEVHVEAYTMRGEKILSRMIQGEMRHDFPIPDWHSGIYLIHLTTQKTSGSTRIIKL